MELYTALFEAERHVKSQFNDNPQPDCPEPDQPRLAALRRGLSVTLHALARAIGPRQPATETAS